MAGLVCHDREQHSVGYSHNRFQCEKKTTRIIGLNSPRVWPDDGGLLFKHFDVAELSTS